MRFSLFIEQFLGSLAGCSSYTCTEPLTATPIGSPCGCVEPISVTIDLDVAPYLLFMRIAELEVEVAAGTFLKQSQVKIMAAVASIQDDQKTRVTIYLVPLREHFDTYTASLISDRFRDKKVQINSSIFGDYKVVNVTYHGKTLYMEYPFRRLPARILFVKVNRCHCRIAIPLTISAWGTGSFRS
jgi:hypothetical protein